MLPIVLAIVLLCLPCAAVTAEGNEAVMNSIDDGTAEPYSKDEFPAWSHDVRRAEIVTIGSLPFTILAATLCYSVGRYTISNFDFDYVPNPFAKSGAGSLNQTEQIGVFATAGGISLCIGITDLIIHIHRRNKRLRQEKERSSWPITITPMDDGEPNADDNLNVDNGTGDNSMDGKPSTYSPPLTSQEE